MEVQKLLQIIEATFSARVVLVDFKPENIVRVHKAGKTYLKAIDFDCTCEEGSDMLGDITPSYSCPEVAISMVKQRTMRSVVSNNASSSTDSSIIGFSFWPMAVPAGPPSSIADAQTRTRPKV